MFDMAAEGGSPRSVSHVRRSFCAHPSHVVRRRSRARVAAGLVSTGLMLVALVRVAVQFAEATSAVRAEREADESLLELCRQGMAISSDKMRNACMAARSEQASPLLFKAMMRAIATAYRDTRDALSSPFNAFVAIFFVLSGLFVPALPWARAMQSVRRRVFFTKRRSVLGGGAGRRLTYKTSSSSSDGDGNGVGQEQGHSDDDEQPPHVVMVSEEDATACFRPAQSSVCATLANLIDLRHLPSGGNDAYDTNDKKRR